MATEVALSIRGRAFSQAVFLHEKEWLLPLLEFRDLLRNRQVDLPNDYKFLTSNGNVVPPPLEETLVLNEVVNKQSMPGSGSDKVGEDGISEEEKPPPFSEQTSLTSVPVINILPSELCNRARSRSNSESASDQTEVNQTQGSSGVDQAGRTCHGCPVVMMKEAFPMLQEFLKPEKLLKVLFILFATLACSVAVLACTFLMVKGAVGGLSSHPLLMDMFRSPADVNALMELKVKLSELEMTTKFEIKDLKQKLAELEDLYLRDLESQRRDLALAKAKQTETENSVARDIQDLTAKLDNMAPVISGLNGNGQETKEKQRDGEGKEKRKHKQGDKRKIRPNI